MIEESAFQASNITGVIFEGNDLKLGDSCFEFTKLKEIQSQAIHLHQITLMKQQEHHTENKHIKQNYNNNN